MRADWGAWGKTKAAEYSQLLESHNQCVEAFGSLQKKHAVMPQQMEEKEVAWAELAEELRETEEKVAVMKPALEALEAEAKEDRDKQKVLDPAREELEKKSALLQEALDDKEAEVAESPTTAGSKLKGIAFKDQKLSEIRSQPAARKEELKAAAAAAMAETAGKGQEELRQGDQEKEVLERRLKGVQQGKLARKRSLVGPI